MRLLVVLVRWAALVGPAAPVHADPEPDASFIGALNNAGITYQKAQHIGGAATLPQPQPSNPLPEFPWPPLPAAR